MKIRKIRLLYNVTMILVVISMIFVTACSNSSTNSTTSNAAPKDTDKAQELKSFKISLSNFMPDQHLMNKELMGPLADALKKGTDGRIDAVVYSGGALGKANEHYDMAATGVADVASVIHGYTTGKFPVTEIGELPFIVPYEGASSLNTTKVLWDLYEKYPQIKEEHKGTRILALFTSDPSVFMLKGDKIKSLDDFKGMKIRTPSLAASGVLEALGAVPVSMPMPSVYDAMQKGVIDGALGVMSALKQFRLAEVVDSVIDARIYGTTFAIVMNENSYNKFKGSDLKLLESLTGKSLSIKGAEAFDREAKEAFEEAKAKGLVIRDLTPEELSRLQELTKPVYENWIKNMDSKGIPGKEIYDEAIRLGKEYSK